MTDCLEGLNASQLEAVTTTEGYVRVIAGAGSGKTRALTRRFAYLVNEAGVLPGSILCVTFTNKAANEMRQRIHNLTGDNDTGYVCTFHSFCVSVLQEDSYAVGYPKSFLVLDNSDVDAMLKVIYEERGLTLRDMTFANARDMIEIQKLFKHPDYYQDLITMDIDVLHEKYLKAESTNDIIFYGYLYQEKKCFGLDYNDLIKFSLYIFEKNEDIKLKWQQRLEYIMIDEFQDIDSLQYALMKVLCGYHGNLFIVGDPDQTIYTWRGADVKYLLDFDREFPDVKTIMMNDNYRSSPQIINTCNSLISANRMRIKKDLVPHCPDGNNVLCHYAPNAEEEAQWIAGKIKELGENGIRYGEIALLYRAHYVTRTVEEVFLKEKIPYNIYSGVQFFNRAEIKDALSYLRMIAFRDDLSFTRIVNTPKRNIGERRMVFLREKAEEGKCSLYEALVRNLDNEIFRGTKASAFIKLIERFSADYAERQISELLADILNASGYETMLRTEGSQERLDNLAELRQAVYEYESSCGEEATLEHFIARTALFTNADTAEKGDKVKLMTVHAAKGLEFPYVFLVEMNEGIFPSSKTKTRKAMEEERRLAFVAMTRARRGLFISEADGRNFDGSPRYPSRFILDIEPEYLEFTHKPDENLISDTREYISVSDNLLDSADTLKLFSEGQRVEHGIFGEGTITAVDRGRGAYSVLFDGMSTARTISFRVKLTEL